jgi:DNA-binding transcriptional MerR regulator
MHQSLKEVSALFNSGAYAKFPELYKSLQEKKFSISDVGVSHRWITYWEEKGLLPETNEKGKWRKFDFVGYTWLKVIMKLREFNIGLNAVKNLKGLLMDPIPDFMGLFLKSPQAKPILDAIAKGYGVGEEQNLFNKPEVMEALKTLKLPPMLFFFILDTLLMKNHFCILINARGEFLPIKESFLDYISGDKPFKEFIYNSYLSISLSEIISQFIKDKDLSLVSNQLHLLTPEETEVLKIIRMGNLKSVKIKFNEKDEIELLELTEEKQLDRSARFIDLIMNHGYQEVVVKTQNGKITYCENTRKIKFNNK